MRKNLFFGILLLFMPALYAGQVLKVHESDISPSFDYSLEEIRRITFSDGQLLVFPIDGTYQNHTLSTIRKITFGEKLKSDPKPTSVSDNPVDEQAVVAYITPSGEMVVKSGAEMLSLALYDISGKRLMHTSASSNSTSLSVTGIPSGVYLLQITTEQGIVVKKIIKS
jgi:WD40 repeat protein